MLIFIWYDKIATFVLFDRFVFLHRYFSTAVAFIEYQLDILQQCLLNIWHSVKQSVVDTSVDMLCA